MNPRVTVRALATLARFAPTGGTMEFVPGETVGDITKRCGLDFSEIGTVLHNGHPAEPDALLTAGDVLSLVPPITGG
jgi:molybdopterin converting factor small subunit